MAKQQQRAKWRATASFIGTIKAWPQRIKSFYSEVRTEMSKVTTPNRKEVQGTTTVVIITVFIFGLYFWVVDKILGSVLAGSYFKYCSTH